MTLSPRPLLAAAIVIAACAPRPVARPAPGQPALPSLAALYPKLRAEYSGDRARETVAFAEQFWRQPGSVGFDTTIAHVVRILEEAGFDRGDGIVAPGRMSYIVQRRPMERPSWTPVDASLEIVGGPMLLQFATNRNMLAINSFATPDTGVVGEVVDVGRGQPADFEGKSLAGKIVFIEGPAGRGFAEGMKKRGAIGVVAYGLPSYLKPEVNRTSIQFGSIPYDTAQRGWGIFLSYAAREELKRAMAAGPVRLRARAKVDMRTAPELTLVAEIRGDSMPDERFVFSAHVQEPGANDNASGVGAQAEMARTLAALVRRGDVSLGRTITFLWGDEISATRRYIAEDSSRAARIRWGMSLDMVGEDTRKTGGTFLIEKMPDPSAVWTRGDDRHSEWGGEPLKVEQLVPHYFNDFVINRCQDQARETGWEVRTNPFEGGSDHTPFLDAKIPGLLMWHFTDQFYHTDNDRLENVSAGEMENVGVCALAASITLVSADAATARFMVAELRATALDRLDREAELSRDSIAKGGDRGEQRRIVATWARYYSDALDTIDDVELGGTSAVVNAAIGAAQRDIGQRAGRLLREVIPDP